MRVYNSFIAILALAFAAITIVLSIYGVDKLDTYFIIYTVALMVLTTLYVTFSPRARRALRTVGLAAFAGVMVIVFRLACFPWQQLNHHTWTLILSPWCLTGCHSCRSTPRGWTTF